MDGNPVDAISSLFGLLTGFPLAVISTLPGLFVVLLIVYLSAAFVLQSRNRMSQWSFIIPAPLFGLAWLLGLWVRAGWFFGEGVAVLYILLMLGSVIWAFANIIRLIIKK